MALKALIILHPGFEEMEAVAPIDLLSRAGVEITQAALEDELLVSGRSGISLRASISLDALPSDAVFDAVILPGGPGIQKIRNHRPVCQLLKRHHEAGKILACICAAPLLLLDAGIIEGLRYTAHPSASEELDAMIDQPIVVDQNLITSRGAGTATEFALAIAEAMTGAESAQEIAESICWSHL
jgi:4-methyl-5(b-hydroxyethyl)-thiazole monophosphate biosynthesis